MQTIEILAKPRRGFDANSIGAAGVMGGFALAWFLPFVWTVHFFPLTSLDSELVSSACLGFALLCCGLLASCRVVLFRPLPAMLLALASIGFAQYQLGMIAYSQQVMRFELFLAAMLAAYALGRQIVALGRTREATDFVCMAALGGGLFSALVQWLQVFDAEILPFWAAAVFNDPDVRHRPFGNLGQANHVTTYLGWATLSALYLGNRLRRDWLVAPFALVLSSGLALSGSRMGAIFLALSIVALFAPTALRSERVLWRWVAAGALLTGYAAGLIGIRTIAGEFDTIARFTQDSLPIRYELLKQAWHIGLQHPLFGVGVGQFPAAQYWIAQAGPYTYPANNCHNLILQLATEFGWPAAIAVGALGLSWGLRDLRARLARPEAALAWGMLLLIAIHSMLEFPLWHLHFAIPSVLVFALGEPERRASITADIRRLLSLSGAATLGVVLAFHLDYSGIAEAAYPLWMESRHVRHRTAEDGLLVYAVADSRLFRPEVDRLLIDMAHAPDEAKHDPLERSSRLIKMLPAPEIITQHIILLARAGRIDEAIVHAKRLRVFAAATYPDCRDWILTKTRDLGPQTAPLRHVLREQS